MSKRDLSEADICAKFITPHVEEAGWDDATQIRREVHFTKGQIHVRGKMVTRGKSKFADYVLTQSRRSTTGAVGAFAEPPLVSCATAPCGHTRQARPSGECDQLAH